jgi:hypothetical protein
MLQDREDGQVFEKVTRHRVELWPARRRDHHAEVERVPFELALDGKRLRPRFRVVCEEGFLRWLKDVLVLRGKVTAGGAGPRRDRGANRRDRRRGREQIPNLTATYLSVLRANAVSDVRRLTPPAGLPRPGGSCAGSYNPPRRERKQATRGD